VDASEFMATGPIYVKRDDSGFTVGYRREALRLIPKAGQHDCGHRERTPGCGGCDPSAIEFVITDEGVRRPFDAARDLTLPPAQQPPTTDGTDR
jgi:hypothetical protein